MGKWDSIRPPNLSRVSDALDFSNQTITDEAIFREVVISNCSVEGQVAEGIVFESVQHNNVKLREAIFERIEMNDLRLQNCDLANMDCREGIFHRVEIVQCRLTCCRFVEIDMQNVLVSDCSGELVQFQFTKFKSCRFEGCDLRESNFQGADLRGVVFSECNLRNAEMSQSILERADLSSSNIDGLRIN